MATNHTTLGPMLPSRVSKRSIVLSGHKTSISMEPEFWDALKREAVERKITLGKLIDLIDEARTHGNLSSACRCHALARALGHGTF